MSVGPGPVLFSFRREPNGPSRSRWGSKTILRKDTHTGWHRFNAQVIALYYTIR